MDDRKEYADLVDRAKSLFAAVQERGGQWPREIAAEMDRIIEAIELCALKLDRGN